MNKNVLKAFFLLMICTILLVTSTTLSATNQSTTNLSTTNEVHKINDTNVKVKATNQNDKSVTKNNANTKINNSNNYLTNNTKTNLNNKTNSNNTTSTSSKSIEKDYRNKTTKEACVMNIPLNKSRYIYFAMDHTNRHDRTICNNIVSTLRNEGFKVIRYRIGPNAMYNNMLYLYNNKISNAIMFHLFNGVDPSNIREVAKYGTENRGRIVRSRGNDVVLAWFYDASDCVNVNGKCYYSVRGSETSGRLYYPRTYMDNNEIYYLCTSSDHYSHKETADYTGIKTAQEFMKLFTKETITKITAKHVVKESVSLTGTVTSNYANNVNGTVTIKDSDNNVLQENVQVNNGVFNTTFNALNSGLQTLTVNYLSNSDYKHSFDTINVTIPKNLTIKVKQIGNKIGYTKLLVSVIDDISKIVEENRTVYFNSHDSVGSVSTNSSGQAIIKVNSTGQDIFEIYCLDDNNDLLNIVKKTVKIKKNDVKVKVDKIIGTIGEKVTLKATLKDQEGKAVKDGYVLFKANGISLNVNNTFDKSLKALKVKVVNGVAKTSMIADSFLRNAKDVTVKYMGSSHYYTKTVEAKTNINKRKISLTVSTSAGSVQAGKSILFTVKVKDVTPNAKNKSIVHKNSYVYFMINGEVLRNSKGKKILVKVGNDNIARFNYTVAPGTAGLTSKLLRKVYNVTAVFSNANYYKSNGKSSATYLVNRSPVKIVVNSAVVQNNKLRIKAQVNDYRGISTVGKQKIVLKINDKEYTVNDKIKYFNAKNGVVNIVLAMNNSNISRITLKCLDNLAYLGNSKSCSVKY